MTISPNQHFLIQQDAWNLFRLLDATISLLSEMSFERDGERDWQLDRIDALLRIARDCSERNAKQADDLPRLVSKGRSA